MHTARGLHFAYAYIDDVLIASNNSDEYLQHLQTVLECFKQFGMVINPSKCELGVTNLQLLGHQVDSEGIRPLEEKVKVIQEFPLPKTRRKLHEFLGLVNFYHRFVKDCATVIKPLNVLLATANDDSHDLQWNDSATAAFTAIKRALATATLLFHHKHDAPTSIMTDASSCAVGAVLQQYIDRQWCPISYFSRKLKPLETKYSTFDRELLAVYLVIKHFRHFVSKSDRYTPRQIRHLDYISQFTNIQHVSGKKLRG